MHLPCHTHEKGGAHAQPGLTDEALLLLHAAQPRVWASSGAGRLRVWSEGGGGDRWASSGVDDFAQRIESVKVRTTRACVCTYMYVCARDHARPAPPHQVAVIAGLAGSVASVPAGLVVDCLLGGSVPQWEYNTDMCVRCCATHGCACSVGRLWSGPCPVLVCSAVPGPLVCGQEGLCLSTHNKATHASSLSLVLPLLLLPALHTHTHTRPHTRAHTKGWPSSVPSWASCTGTRLEKTATRS
jgi:hypothetical protein